MDNKYYTPSLEEFHIEFRYEYNSESYLSLLDSTSGNWKKEVFNACCGQDGESEFHDLLRLLEIGGLRVKFLDKDDIEELGWGYKGKHWFYLQDEYYEINVDYFTSFYLHKHNSSDTGRGGYTIIESTPGGYSLEGDVYKFDGELRNYNELKFIMERTGIRKD